MQLVVVLFTKSSLYKIWTYNPKIPKIQYFLVGKATKSAKRAFSKDYFKLPSSKYLSDGFQYR
jgi:hypothetical protein